ncbi:MAG: hypothetical protein IK007_08045, partial [Lachnospiraceae bacterium]|nr:hypothetical protein [Lachnospiraceae bacterium]
MNIKKNNSIKPFVKARFKSVFSFILIISFIVGIIGVAPINTIQVKANNHLSGNGTVDDPYVISTAEQLNTLREIVEGDNIVYQRDSFEGKYIVLNADIDLSEYKNWKPIGTSEELPIQQGILTERKNAPFKGTFDGNGHIITGLTINNSAKNELGLFGYNIGTIKNLTVDASITGNEQIGIIAGKNCGTIERCTTLGSVKGKKYTGGIVGYMPFSYNGFALVSGYTNNRTVNCLNKASIDGVDYTGGITGYSRGIVESCSNEGIIYGSGSYTSGIVAYNDGLIKDCFNATSGYVNGKYYTGGIAGMNQYGIENCTNNASISSNEDNKGGIVSVCKGYITGCLNTGSICGNDSDYNGGIAGKIEGNSSSLADSLFIVPYEIKNCTNKGEICCGGKYHAGIVGYSSKAVISDCVNEGKTNSGLYRGGIVAYALETNIENCSNYGYIIGFNNIGGIVGDSEDCDLISNCANYGILESDNPSYAEELGGIIGRCKNLNLMIYCSNSGKIVPHKVSSCNIGGIIGYIISGSVKMNYCTNYSNITGDHDIGGIIGKNVSGHLTDCSNRGDISGIYNIGGICGASEGGVFWWCCNSGDISFVDNEKNKKDEGLYFGGLIGYSKDNAIYYGLNNGSISGNCLVGGISGYNDHGNLDHCYNNGYIKALSKNKEGDSLTGGISGMVDGTEITSSANKGDVWGNGKCVGGITGKLKGSNGKLSYKLLEEYTRFEKNGDGKIYNSYNRGYVSGEDYIGGLVGFSNIWQRISWCYDYSEPPKANGSNVGKLVGGYDGYAIFYESDVDGLPNRSVSCYFNLSKCIFTNGNNNPTGWDPVNSLV